MNPEKIFLPPLHIKLGLIKVFVKAMGKTNSRGFKYLCEKFPKISSAKLKGVFVGPQIREIFKDNAFVKTLNDKRRLLGRVLCGFVIIFWANTNLLISKKAWKSS